MASSASAAVPTAVVLDVAVADRGHDVGPLDLVVLDDSGASAPPGPGTPGCSEKASSSDSTAHRLIQEREGPEFLPALPTVVDGDDVDGDVAGARRRA